MGTPGTIPRQKPFAERILDVADVPPPPSELPYLFGQYIVQGATHWLTGGTGIGKSTIGFNIASALADGRELWEIPCKPCRVLYVDLESGDIGRSMKVQKIYKDRERPRDRFYFLKESASLFEDVTDLLSHIRDHGINLVIFDTARRCFRVKDENDNAEVYTKVIPLLDVLKAKGVASLIFGHPAKHDGTRARGAGAQEDAGDVNLSLTVHSGEATSEAAIVTLRVTKHRLLGLSVPPLYLRRMGNDEFERIYLEPDATGNAGVPTVQQRCLEDITAYLSTRRQNPTRHGVIQTAMRAMGHSQATINRTLKEATADSWLFKTADGYTMPDPFDGDNDD